jgi:hypothetical protein
MPSIQKDMQELRRQLQSGSIQRAYRGMLRYMTDLRTHLQGRYPTYSFTSLYQGYFDMTYFALVPPSLRQRGLKIAIVFNYGAFRFEAWLAAANRQIQRRTWESLKDARWPGYRVATPGAGVDAIIECDLADEFDLSDPQALTAAIDKKLAKFTRDIEKALAKTPRK